VRILSGDKKIAFNPDKWDLQDVPLEKFGKTELDVLTWYHLHLGKPYDTVAMAGCAFNLLGNANDKYMCCESIMAALGVKEAWRFTPPLMFTLIEALKNK
jgi:hypothetical protein